MHIAASVAKQVQRRFTEAGTLVEANVVLHEFYEQSGVWLELTAHAKTMNTLMLVDPAPVHGAQAASRRTARRLRDAYAQDLRVSTIKRGE